MEVLTQPYNLGKSLCLHKQLHSCSPQSRFQPHVILYLPAHLCLHSRLLNNLRVKKISEGRGASMS